MVDRNKAEGGWRIGIDLGGTKIEAILLDPQGTEAWRQRVATPSHSYQAILEAIGDLCRQAQRHAQGATSIGIGMPGALSHKTGRVKNSNTAVLNDQPMLEDLERQIGQSVRIENDANCFVVSEAMDGAGAGAAVVFGVILGTGVGGGLVVNRRLLSGLHHIAGEWGHNPMPVTALDPAIPAVQEVACYCGRINCIETFLSGPGWLKREQALAVNCSGESMPRWAHSTHDLVAAACDEPLASDAIDRYGTQLAAALAGVINLLDPQVIVLGGGLGQIDALYPIVRERIGRHVFSDECRTEICKPLHGDSSGVRGAARLWETT